MALYEPVTGIEGGVRFPTQSSVQVGGDHYKKMKHQPLEITLDNLGYEAFRGACITKINKYLMREKGDNYKEDVGKALHILKWLHEETN